jgi:hypothetical protein
MLRGTLRDRGAQVPLAFRLWPITSVPQFGPRLLLVEPNSSNSKILGPPPAMGAPHLNVLPTHRLARGSTAIGVGEGVTERVEGHPSLSFAILIVPTNWGITVMEAIDFTSSALIGQLVAANLAAKLVSRNVLSGADAREIMDDALLLLERTQVGFPENEAAFVEARRFLEEQASFYGSSNAP